MSDTELLPARYDAMCRAIDAAYEVDEVKDIRDKARAMQMYLRQAKNTEAERRACEIRLRAERKAGQLISEMEKAKGAAEPGTNRGMTPLPDVRASRPTLDDLGISYKQSSDWQRLARVPEDEFEAALANPDEMPTTAGIIGKPKKDEPVEDDALWLWGRLLDFERRGLLGRRFEDVCRTMVPHMRETVRELAPKVSLWLDGA